MTWRPQEGMPQPEMNPPSDGPIADGYANPDATTPYPAPDGRLRPVGYWESASWSASWVRSSTAWTASWASVPFDLRTDLRGVNSREFSGVPLNRTSAVQMWIAISGLSNNHLGMRVLMSQWGHPVDAAKVAQFVPLTNVTGYLATGLDMALLDFWPPGSGYQMRYWQVRLRFSFPLNSLALPARLPALQLQAGVY